MKFTSAKTAIHYGFNYQLMKGEDQYILLQVAVQRSAANPSEKVWLSVEMGDLVRPMNQLKGLELAWGMFAYAGKSFYSTEQLEQLMDHVVNESIRTLKMKNITQNVRDKLPKLAYMALNDFAHREVTRQKKFTAAQICKAIGVNHSHWDLHWLEKFKAMQKPLESLSARSLAPVSQKINQRLEEYINEQFDENLNLEREILKCS